MLISFQIRQKKIHISESIEARSLKLHYNIDHIHVHKKKNNIYTLKNCSHSHVDLRSNSLHQFVHMVDVARGSWDRQVGSH